MDNSVMVAVIGAGNGGLAFAANMAYHGANVKIFDKFPQATQALKSTGQLTLLQSDQQITVNIQVSDNLKELLSNTRLIMIVTPANAHKSLAAEIAPHLCDGSKIILNPGRTGGAVEVYKIIKNLRNDLDFTVAEAQTLLFATRKIAPCTVQVSGIKRKVAIAAIPFERTISIVKELNVFFPQFFPANSILETSLSNIGAIFHPTPVIMNTGRIESGISFEYYHEGITPSVAKVLEAMDAERISVAKACGVNVLTAVEWLKDAYSVNGNSLYECLQNNPAYRGIKAPESINVRYIYEDVPTGLVPISLLGKKLCVPTPTIDGMVNIACHLLNTDYWSHGRHIDTPL